MTKTTPTFFMFAGEPSGDLHGSHLLKELKSLLPELKTFGVGGPYLRKEGLRCLLKMEDFEVMGLSDVLKSLPKLWSHFHKVLQAILASSPEIVILIDYPGFNLRLAKALKKKGFKGKIVQYVSPTVWAHSPKRIQAMAKTLDLLLTIFPFEASYFSSTPLKVQFVGNPLVEYKLAYTFCTSWKGLLKIPLTHPLIALFPGSRAKEIKSHLPILLQTAEWLKRKKPELIFGISCVNEESTFEIYEALKKSSLKHGHDVFLIPKQYSYELMDESHLAIAKSGTVALELALHACPTIVIYKLSLINWLYAKLFLKLKLPFYCLVNILGGKEIFPELIEKSCCYQSIAEKALTFLESSLARNQCVDDCVKLYESLSKEPASKKAAIGVLELL